MYNISFYQMAMFFEVAKRLNITAVSEQVHISPAALSKIIHRLEDHLELQLFERSNKGLQLTPAGKMLLSRAESPFQSICNTVEEIKAEGKNASSEVNIGYFSTIDINSDYAKLNMFIQKYKQQHPQVKINERLYDLAELKSKLRYGDVDLAFLPNFEVYDLGNNVDSRSILKYRIHLAVGKHNSAIVQDDIDLAQLRKQPVLTFNKTADAKSYHILSRFLLEVIGVEDESGVKKEEVPNLDTMIRRLKYSDCYALVGNLRNDPDIRLFAVSEKEYLCSMHVVWRTENIGFAAKQFIDEVLRNRDAFSCYPL